MIRDESFADVTYHIRGELVPELQVVLGPGSVMFEHHVLLWKETRVEIELKKLPGGVKRKIAGLDYFVTRTFGAGHIAFSRDAPGQCIPMHLTLGEGLDVREHQFIAATDNLDYTFERVKGIQNMLLGGTGFFIDKFRATTGDAIVWLHGNGNVFLVELGAGEQLDVEAGAWLYKDPTRHDGVGHDGAEDGADGRRRQAHLEPLHRPRAPGDPDDVHRAGGGRGGRQRAGRDGRGARGGFDRRVDSGVGGGRPPSVARADKEEVATTIRPMTVKERLHLLVDELSEAEADDALRYVASRREGGEGDPEAVRPGDIVDEWGNLSALRRASSAAKLGRLDREEIAEFGETIGDAFARAEREAGR